MAITNEQYLRVLARLTKLETMANDLAVAQSNLVSLLQVNQLLTVISAQLTDLGEQVDALENRVTGIEEEPLT